MFHIDEKPWIHVPEDYIARYQQHVTSESYIGLCTTQFTSCWPIIIVHQPNQSNNAVKASLMHYGDASSPHLIKSEIDHMQNKIEDKFVVDNCYIFIYRQLARKMTWSKQIHKIGLIEMLQQYADKQNLKIIDLPPNKNDDNLGFIGIKFEHLNQIRSNMSAKQLNTFITKSMLLLERTDRDNLVHKNPFCLIRHPHELQLRCCQTFSPIFGEPNRNDYEVPVIFDKSHWVNIDKHICHDALLVFMDIFKNKQFNTHFSVVGKCAEEYKQVDPGRAINSPHSEGNIISMAVAVQLWNNNFDLKQIFEKGIQELEARVQKQPDFTSFLNERYNMNYTKTQIVNFVEELKSIVKQENWVCYSERIYIIANELYPIRILTAFTQIYSYILIYIYHSKLEDIKKLSTDCSTKGKEMYINNKFDDAVLYFSKSLRFAIMCFVDPSLELIRAYYNLGSAYHKNTDLFNAKRLLSIAQNICNTIGIKKSATINSLSQKISKRLSEISV